MPVVLEKENEEGWLDPSSGKGRLSQMLLPYPSSVLAAYTISDLVNRKVPERNSPEVIRPFIRKSENTLF
jgi:putative SOS response-associated peptidase YedK